MKPIPRWHIVLFAILLLSPLWGWIAAKVWPRPAGGGGAVKIKAIYIDGVWIPLEF